MVLVRIIWAGRVEFPKPLLLFPTPLVLVPPRVAPWAKLLEFIEV